MISIPRFFLIYGILFLNTIRVLYPSLCGHSTKDDFSFFIIQDIQIKGNNVTKDKIIFRELTFACGDSIEKEELKQKLIISRQNLLNTLLFNYVTFSVDTIGDNRIFVIIILEERWYFWPYPILEHADRNLSSFIHQKEWGKMNYGFYSGHYNFRGRKEIVKVKIRGGYKEQYAISYINPGLDKKQRNGITWTTSYSRQHETACMTEHNQLRYWKDEKHFSRIMLASSFFYSYRPLFFNRHIFCFEYMNAQVQDTIIELNADYFVFAQTQMNYLSMGYFFSRDKRDSKIYPLQGYYMDIGFVQRGLGFIDKEKPNFPYIIGSFAIYSRISDHCFFASGIRGKSSYLKKKYPYFLNQSLGYEDYLRGYEYYVMDGKNYYINKTILKYELIPTHIREIRFIPFTQFKKIHYAVYLSVFFDNGYVFDKFAPVSNDMVNDFLYSGGIGIDLVTYYDNVFRIEYSVNKTGRGGIFLHYGVPVLNF